MHATEDADALAAKHCGAPTGPYYQHGSDGTCDKVVLEVGRASAGAMGLMSYENVVVPLDLGASSIARLKLAAGLAVRFDARLTGIAAREASRPYGHGKGGLITSKMIDSERHHTIFELSRVEAMFRKETENLERAEYYSAAMGPQAFLIEQTRTADLVVCNRPYDGTIDAWFSDLSPGTLLMRLGCPLLIAPLGLDAVAGRRIVVAWKDTREARRAVRDSQPFLRKAEAVFFVVVGPDTEADSAKDITASLTQKGVCCKIVAISKGRLRVSAEILKLAADEGADLLVTGAYGHARLHEFIYGSVTRDLLNTSPISCLMAH